MQLAWVDSRQLQVKDGWLYGPVAEESRVTPFSYTMMALTLNFKGIWFWRGYCWAAIVVHSNSKATARTDKEALNSEKT